VLRLAPTRHGLMFDEVLVFPNGVTLIAVNGEPLLRYPSLAAMMQAHGLEAHELRAYDDVASG